jgi:hypothetical protein
MSTAAEAFVLATAKRKAQEIVKSRHWRADADSDVLYKELRRLAHAIYPAVDALRAPALAEMRRAFPVYDDLEREWLLDWALERVAAGGLPPEPPRDPLDSFPPRTRRTLREALAQSCRDERSL